MFEDTINQLRLVKHDICELQKAKTQGAILRSKATWAMQSELPTKYFLNLEKKRALSKTFFRVDTDEGEIVTSETGVLNEIKKFYKTLYTSGGEIDYSYLDTFDIPIISEETKKYLDRPLEEKEVSLALSQLNNGKSPGVDGLPPEFIKFFWYKLKHFYVNLMREIIEEGKIHLSACRGILSLLEKVGKQPRKLTSWRPLTILVSDNKIYGKILANRLNYAINEIVHFSQTGFIKGRHIAENILKIMEIINFCENENQNALLISYDFYKAFDSVEWESIFATLVAFNFGSKYIDMVLTLFTDPLICASNNGFWTEFWNPTRGCRQGCTFSPAIFAITVEMLSLGIRQNKNIEGIRIGNLLIKSGQFADELWTVTPPNQNSVNETLEQLERFRAFSGLKINSEKCSILRIGPHKNTDAKFYTLKKLFWSPKHITILGIHIYPDPLVIYMENFIPLLDKAQTIMEKWSTRNITIMGKVTIINHLINSLFIYKLMALPSPPQEFFKIYRRLVKEFLWNGGVVKIAYHKMVQDYSRLGLKLVDLECKNISLKASWPVRWKERDFEEIEWMYHLFPVKNRLIWEGNVNSKDLAGLAKANALSVSIQILYAWATVNFTNEISTYEDVMHEMIWGNSHIRRGNQPI